MSTLVFLLLARFAHTGKHPGPYCPKGQRSESFSKAFNERGERWMQVMIKGPVLGKKPTLNVFVFLSHSRLSPFSFSFIDYQILLFQEDVLEEDKKSRSSHTIAHTHQFTVNFLTGPSQSPVCIEQFSLSLYSGWMSLL